MEQCANTFFWPPSSKKVFHSTNPGAETPSPHPIIYSQQTQPHFGKQVQPIWL